MGAKTNQHAGGKVSAKSLVIDLLSTMPPHHPVAVAALVRAAAVFGIGENAMRVTLARLRSRGMVESDQRGLYRLSRAALPVNREVRTWSTIETNVLSWDGSFIGIDTSGLSSRDGVVPLSHRFDIAGRLARSVTDFALLLDATVGSDPSDPVTAEADANVPDSYTTALDADALRGARIGVLTMLVRQDPEDEPVGRAVRRPSG